MKYLCIAILVVLVSVSSANAAEQGKHLFILSGQSNMQGLNPNLSFKPTVETSFGKDNVIVVQWAYGGQPILRWDKQWQQPVGMEAPKTTTTFSKDWDKRGDVYRRMMMFVNKAIKGQNLASVSFVWMQGESDAAQGWGQVYEESFFRVLTQLKGELKLDEINVVIGRLSDFDMNNEKYPHWTNMRDIQSKMAVENDNINLVDTDDLNDGMQKIGKMKTAKKVKNDLHYTIEGYKTLGKRFAEASIELIQENTQQGAAPKP